ncbi:MAG: dihydrofolate reductase family protein [Bacteroidota bacterium]
MQPLIYHVATTLDGFIAHPDGSFDGFSWDEAVVTDFLSEIQQFGTVLMGRKTYEVGLREGKTSPYPFLRQIVFSRTMTSSPDEAIELVQGDMVRVTRRLKAEAEAPVWLCGGGEIAATLMEAGLIDEVVVKLNPIVFGNGIPLFGTVLQQTKLVLTDTKRYDCDVLLLRYAIAS